MILSCKDIHYTYSVDPILNGISFHINEGEQTAIVGTNGAGKTTLFKILTGELIPDEGNIYISNNTSIGYLSQHMDYEMGHSVFEEVYQANQTLLSLKERLDSFERTLAQTKSPSEKLLNDYHQAQEDFQAIGGYGYLSLVKGVLKGLGFTDEQFTQSVNTLSGGQKTRVALSKLLLIQPDLLLLDEPTNHLDLDAIRWLENYLNGYKGTLLIISHDRYFLDKLVTKVVDLELGKSTIYKGNYSSFIKKKEISEAITAKHYEQQQAEIKRQEDIIKRLRSYRDEKFIKRAMSREKAIDRMEKLERPQNLRTNMSLNLNPKRESGIDVLKINDLSMSFGDRKLFSNLCLDIYKGDKIALIGNNGSGKTTLFRLLMGELNPVHGRYRLGTGVELAYYDQEHDSLHHELTLIEEIAEEFPKMELSRIRNLLAAFLFTGDEVFKEVGTLSGGEKGRLSLAKLMLSKGNFLLLDEPTNHLDMVSKEVLENALNRYSGTLFFISHDRYFINRVATKVVELTPNGLTLYLGNYDYYLEKKMSLNAQDPTVNEQTSSETKKDWLSQKEELRKERMTQGQIAKLEKEIESLEEEIEEINKSLEKEEVFKDYKKSGELIQEREEAQHHLESAMEKWEALHEQL